MNTQTPTPVQDLLGYTLAFCDDCLNRKDFTAAWQAVCRAVSLAPESADMRVHRGRLALFLNDTETAQRDFAAALELSPRCAAAISGLARYHLRQGELVEAEAAAERALGIDPAEAEAMQVKTEIQQERANARRQEAWIATTTSTGNSGVSSFTSAPPQQSRSQSIDGESSRSSAEERRTLPTPDLSPDLWRQDEPLRRAAELIEGSGGRISAVSFDFFDTIVWRLVAKPTDVFNEVGERLKAQGLLRATISPAEFEVLRRHAEGRARGMQMAKDRSMEDIGIAAIYRELAAVVSDPLVGARVEHGAECDLCMLNPVMVSFIRYLHGRGLELLIVSDIYFSADQLRAILRANDFDSNLFDRVLTSCDERVCKGTGNLFKRALELQKLDATQMLHIGDNFDADVVGARRAGVRGCHYPQASESARTMLDRERFLLGGQEMVFSGNSIRLLAARLFPGDTDEAHFGQWGALLMGPLLTRFSAWACQQFVAGGVQKVGALMREGELLGKLLQEESDLQGHGLEVTPLYLNRKSTELAALGALTAKNLTDWLGRRTTLPVKIILADFGLVAGELGHLPFGLEEKVSKPEEILRFAKFLFTPAIAKRIEAKSAEERRKVMDYLHPWLVDRGAFGVCDLGYGASAQTQIKRIFDLEEIRIQIVGCYVVSDERAADRVLNGVDIRSYLGAYGNPGFSVRAFLRSPAFMEQIIVAPLGTTLGYERQADGSVTPILDKMPFDEVTLRRQRAFKAGVICFQKLWHWAGHCKTGLLDGKSNLARRIFADLDRGFVPILARAAAFPMQAEAAAFGSLALDDYYYADSFKRLCSDSDCEKLLKLGYSHLVNEAGSHWPQGVNQLVNQKHTDHYFAHGRAMLLAGGASLEDKGAPPALTVIVRAESDIDRLSACLARLKSASGGAHSMEVVALVSQVDEKIQKLMARLSSTTKRFWAVKLEPQHPLVTQLNAQVDRSSAGFLLFMDDKVHLPMDWDLRILEAMDCRETGIVFPKVTDKMAATDPAAKDLAVRSRCFCIRRSAFVEALGFCPQLGLAGALGNLLIELRDLHWQLGDGHAIHFDAKLPFETEKTTATDVETLTRASPDLSDTIVVAGRAKSNPAPAFDRLGLSIIVLVLNQLEHTRRCLDSLALHTSAPHEIIVVDNGSSDGTPEFLREWQARTSHGIVIREEVNRGFAAGNNLGLAVARGEFIVLLNNDTVVTPGWLEAMLAVYKQFPAVGIVGPRSNRVSGPQLVSEVGYNSLDELPDFAATWARTHAGESQAANRVVGFCLLARRAVIEGIGGLDEQFGSGNFEDDDFCIRAKLAGFETRIVDDSFVHHVGNATFNGAGVDYAKAMQTNWGVFRRKWAIPPETSSVPGYVMPKAAPPGVSLKVPLPELEATHNRSPDGRSWTDRGTPPAAAPDQIKNSSQIQPKVSPRSATAGDLAAARQMHRQKNFSGAWVATLAAVEARSFHPEAYLLLAEIAQAAGDGDSARRCVQHVQKTVPKFRPNDPLLKIKFRGGVRPEWLVLPASIEPAGPRSESGAQVPEKSARTTVAVS